MIGKPGEAKPLGEDFFLFARNFLPEGSGIYPFDGKFAGILFNMPFEECISTADSLVRDYERKTGTGLLIGLSPVSERDISASRIIKEAERALSRTVDRAGERVVGFKPDPNRFREINSSTE